MNQTEDVRVTKSKRDLRNGLIELLRDIPFEKLTVSEICRAAMINKMTFYKHYADKYALLDDCIRAIAIDIYTKSVGAQPRDLLQGDVVTNCVKLLEEVLSECNRQRKVIFALVNSNNTLNSWILTTSIAKMIESLLTQVAAVRKLKYPAKTIAGFLSGGFSNLIWEQLRDLSEQSKERFLASTHLFFTDMFTKNIIFE